MMSLPLQTTTVAVDTEVLMYIGFLVAVVLSLVIGVKGLQSYRESNDRGIALLTVGILLLSGVAFSINTALTTFTAVPVRVVIMTGNLVRLLGIVIILVAIYDI